MDSGMSHPRRLTAGKKSSRSGSVDATTDVVRSADISSQNWTLADLPVESMRIDGNVMPPRVVGRHNHIIAGIHLRQKRTASATHGCNTRFRHLSSKCNTEELGDSGSTTATSPFGTDPAFNIRSSLFSADAAKNEDDYYNTSAASSELSASGFPAAFFPRWGSKGKPEFVLVMPVCPSASSMAILCY
jgi:hypothetical protein